MTERTYIKIVTASFFIGIGIVLLFNNLHMFSTPLPEYYFTWQALLILVGAYHLIAFRSMAGPVIMMVGLYFIAPDVPGLAGYNLQAFWPVVLILIGLMIFLKSLFKRPSKKIKIVMKETNAPGNIYYSSVIMGGERKKLSDYDFKGATLQAICGGLELDLTDCYLSKDKETVIDVKVICGGISLKVSKDWNVKNDVSPIMGGIEDHINDMSDNYVDPAAVVRLTGTLIMGGIEIKRV